MIAASESFDGDDYFWDDLLADIDGGSVVPVVGPEIVTVSTDAGEVVTLQHHLATELAKALRVSDRALPDKYVINDVACAYLRDDDAVKTRIHDRIRRILEKADLKPPQRLRDLAGIGGFGPGHIIR